MTVPACTDDNIVFKIDSSFVPDKIHIIEEKLDDIVNYHEKDVSIDMSGLSHLDSLLLSVLIRFRARLSICGRNLHLINCNERIISGIKLAALEDYFLG